MMFQRKIIFATFLFILTQVSFAEGIKSTPMSYYSGGIALGNLQTLKVPLRKEQSQLFQISWLNSWVFHPMLAVNLDLDWTAPGNGWGTELGITARYPLGMLAPFVGLSGGIRDLARKSASFGKSFGPAGTARAGLLFFPEEDYHFFIVANYLVVGNSFSDKAAGIAIGFTMDTSRKKIRKLAL